MSRCPTAACGLLPQGVFCAAMACLNAHAVPAYFPPEIAPANEVGLGVQMQVEGRMAPGMDTEATRASRRQICAARGQAYVNNEPLGRHGSFRETRVQLNERSYSWREVTWVKEEPGSLCRFRTETQRTLTVASFDGQQTRLETYDYGRREVRVTVGRGDHTAIGSQAPSRRTALGSITDSPVVGRRELAGLACTEHLYSAGPMGGGRRVCVSRPEPFPGRRIAVILAERWGDTSVVAMEWQATALQHAVDVNHGVFRGPRGFADITHTRSAASTAAAAAR